MKYHYEQDTNNFPADAYQVKGWSKGIAFAVLGWHTEPDEDSEWSGIENRTGQVVAMMIGDDRHFLCDLDDLTPITQDQFCCVCGQVGCHCNY